MTKKFFLTDKIIYIAPILVIASFFHLFSRNEATHRFGQIEILGSLIIVCYYLWDKIAEIYTPDKIGKKRIEAIVCMVVGIFSALVFFPPLMTWQYYNLYNNSNRYSFNAQILTAIITVWVGVGAMWYSSYILLAERVAAQNAATAESDATGYVAPGMSPATQQGQ